VAVLEQIIIALDQRVHMLEAAMGRD